MCPSAPSPQELYRAAKTLCSQKHPEEECPESWYSFFSPTHTLFFSILCCCFSVRQCLEYLPALHSSKRNIVLQQLVLLSPQWGLFHYGSQYLHLIHSRITEGRLPDNSLCAFILLKVEVDSDCTKVALGQRVAVTVKTVPSYCGIDWRGTYEAPGKNLRRLFPVG